MNNAMMTDYWKYDDEDVDASVSNTDFALKALPYG